MKTKSRYKKSPLPMWFCSFNKSRGESTTTKVCMDKGGGIEYRHHNNDGYHSHWQNRRRAVLLMLWTSEVEAVGGVSSWPPAFQNHHPSLGAFFARKTPHAHSSVLPPHSSQKPGCQGCCHQPGFLPSFLTLSEGSNICDLNCPRLLQIPV